MKTLLCLVGYTVATTQATTVTSSDAQEPTGARTIPPVTTLNPELLSFFKTTHATEVNKWLSEALDDIKAHETFMWAPQATESA